MMASARRPSSGRIREEGEAAFFAWAPVFVCLDRRGAKPMTSFLPNRSAVSLCSFINSLMYKINCNNLMSLIYQRFYNKSTNISSRSCYRYFHNLYHTTLIISATPFFIYIYSYTFKYIFLQYQPHFITITFIRQ